MGNLEVDLFKFVSMWLLTYPKDEWVRGKELYKHDWFNAVNAITVDRFGYVDYKYIDGWLCHRLTDKAIEFFQNGGFENEQASS
jgi:hypothetical protein